MIDVLDSHIQNIDTSSGLIFLQMTPLRVKRFVIKAQNKCTLPSFRKLSKTDVSNRAK